MVTELVNKLGSLMTSQSRIVAACHEFYSKLYSQRRGSPSISASHAWAFDNMASRITPSMARTLAEPLSLKELTSALKQIAPSKFTRTYGVVTELYKTLWPVIGSEYCDMLQTAVSHNALPIGVTEGFIILYKGGPCSFLNNWSPITLLNVSYKLFAKALHVRLQPILMEVISYDQSTFLSMCFILDNIFLTYKTIHYAKQSRQLLLFLKLDFSNAYDKVNLAFFLQLLDALDSQSISWPWCSCFSGMLLPRSALMVNP